MQRDWTNVGREFVSQAYASRGATPDHERVRARIGAQIDDLKWREPHGSFPFSPGEALKQAVQEFRIPRVSAVAINGYLRLPDGPETATYSIYGVEGNYRNGRVRHYLLDAGTVIVPLASDVMNDEAEEATR